MVHQDQHLAEVFSQPPLTGFKRQPNIRSYLIRAQLPEPEPRYPKRNLKGMKKCENNCTACPFILEGKSVKINTKTDWKISTAATCSSFNVVYMIECQKEKCKMRYIGETKRTLKLRLADHRGYVTKNDTTQATGAHFCLPGHSLSDMKITVLEKVKKHNDQYRKKREEYLIQKFNTMNQGLNRK